MELSLLLMQKILSMGLMIAIGFIACKKGIVKDSSVLSSLCLYVVCPCMTISAFQMEFSTEKLIGLGVCLAGAVVAHAVFLAATGIAGKVLHLRPVEIASMVYSNAGNLIIPLVVSVLGKDNVLFVTPFLALQNLLIWTHGAYVMGGKSEVSLKKVVFNPNIIGIFIGLTMFLLNLELPTIIGSTLDGIGDMVGPISMIVIGIIMANSNLKEVLTSGRAYLICLGRLIILPLITIGVFALIRLTKIAPGAEQYLIVTMLAVSAPSASSITMMAQVYNSDYPRASVINILSVLGCLVTIPVMIYIYQLVCF